MGREKDFSQREVDAVGVRGNDYQTRKRRSRGRGFIPSYPNRAIVKGPVFFFSFFFFFSFSGKDGEGGGGGERTFPKRSVPLNSGHGYWISSL